MAVPSSQELACRFRCVVVALFAGLRRKRGCALSPLLGAVFLNVLDDAMEKLGLFYVRFMDDMLV